MAFTPANPPLNPRLMDLYSLVGDRLGLIRTCYDARRLRNGRPDHDMPYGVTIRCAMAGARFPKPAQTKRSGAIAAVRTAFTYQIQKAQEMWGAYANSGPRCSRRTKKGDAEALASIRRRT